MNIARLISLAFVSFLSISFAQNSFAAVFTVTNTNDSGAGSLRQAILDANVNNADDTINFDPSVFNVARVIILTSGELVIMPDNAAGTVRTLTINGTGPTMLEINGNNNSRVFRIGTSASGFIDRVKVSGGNGTSNGEGPDINALGGGILVEGGNLGGYYSLTLTNSIVSGNEVSHNFSHGGGLTVFGATVIANCAILNNNAVHSAGGLYYLGEVRMFNSTIASNMAQTGGGAYGNNGGLILVNSTVTRNTGGGVVATTFFHFHRNFFPRNSILTANQPSDAEGQMTSAGHNIFGATRFLADPIPATDLVGAEPLLSASLVPGVAGVPSYTFAPGSPAVDSGNNCVLTTTAAGGCYDIAVTQDFRGGLRPQDADSNGIATVDRGTFEITPVEVGQSPAKPDLLAEDDAGFSNTDNVTNVSQVTFHIANLTPTATVELLRNNVVVATGTAVGTTITLDDTLTVSGVYTYTARQIVGGVTGLQGLAMSVNFDIVAPTGTITQDTGTDPTNLQPVNFRLIFSEPITGFNPLDFSLAGSTANVSAANFVVNGVLPSLRVGVSNIQSNGTVVLSYTAGTIQDLAGNPNAVINGPDNSVTYDGTRPTVTINQAAGQSDPTPIQPINFTAVFSEPVTGFSAGDILLNSTANINNAVVTVTGSGTTYNVAISGVTGTGVILVNVRNNAAVDSAGNTSMPSTSGDNAVSLVSRFTLFDYDGDGKSDVSVFRPAENRWYILQSSNSAVVERQFAIAGDIPVPADYDGDGKTDVAVFRPSSGDWWYLSSINGGQFNVPWGTAGDIPRPSDFDGDGKTDFVLFRPSDGGWYRLGSTGVTSIIAFGLSDDKPLVGDFDGDGKGDPAIFRPSTGDWWYAASSAGNQHRPFHWGATGDIPAPADYDADGKTDFAIFRPSDGSWYVLFSAAQNYTALYFGTNGDRPVAADYDGDGKADIAVFRPSAGDWYLLRSTAGFTATHWGATGDVATESAFVP